VSRASRAGVAGAWSVLAVLGALLAGCGVPRDDVPRAVPSGEVDPRLLGATASPSASSPPSTIDAVYRVAFVAADDRLALVPRAVSGTPVPRAAQDLLGALATGPDDAEHERGLSTALPSDVTLRVTALRGRVIEVAIEGGNADADARRLPLSVAQVVLTLTSLPQVDAVRLTRGGDPVQAPLPNGELASRALTAADYRPLLTGRDASAAASDPAP